MANEEGVDLNLCSLVINRAEADPVRDILHDVDGHVAHLCATAAKLNTSDLL